MEFRCTQQKRAIAYLEQETGTNPQELARGNSDRDIGARETDGGRIHDSEDSLRRCFGESGRRSRRAGILTLQLAWEEYRQVHPGVRGANSDINEGALKVSQFDRLALLACDLHDAETV
jgi:hypothetical protein